ncbi:retrovirus-related Pol polyprotein from transposon opus [Trichonephila clavipes]|nr:retrovirus-related Pol polyprotein from transposon opus [Trichonephila clavipes]
MPFGLCNAPATFERLMETVLKGLTFEACLIYLDDVIIGGKEVNYLGHIISAEGVRTDPEKVSAVKRWKRPENLLDKECEDSFLQLKEALTSSPILIYPQPDKPFILDTDASNESVGAVLSQEIDGQERVVAYWPDGYNASTSITLTSDIVKAPRMEMLMPFQEDHAQKIVVIVPE